MAKRKHQNGIITTTRLSENGQNSTQCNQDVCLKTPAKKADPKSTKKAAPAKAKKEGSGGGKAKKKKWSKGKVRDKLNNLILFDKATYDKLLKEVPSYKLITPSVVSERLKVRGSLAKQALRELHSKGLIRLVSKHSSQLIYTRTTKTTDE
ncbi:hypothetical protein BaRGS_00039983 [Batillaria attramentaria]|uniref:40S ribosomal protein S25 n=1 Tax=Batillaria attramentaria TaxID=370345 RepID=A0ABD0J1E3_9CAEN